LNQFAVKLEPFSGLLAAPVFARLMCAVEFVVVPFGLYCTTIVQFPPGLMTEPETHVPPVIENAPAAGPAVLTTAGAAVSVSGPVADAALLTVTVPVLMLVPPVLSAGEGAEIDGVALVTVKVTPFDVPLGVTTVTV
jgi:hypothetical protein